MRVAQRAYLGFHFESADVASKQDGGQKPFHVEASVTVKNVGNTPAYIETVKKELYAIEGDNMWDHIGGSTEQSPNFDVISANEPLLIKYEADFSNQDLTGDRSLLYRIEIRWHDAFNEPQPPTVYCGILADVNSPIVGKRSLSSEPCIKGMTFGVLHK
jgi:hypothetical protein